MSIHTLAAALELKPKLEMIQTQTKIKKLVRRNASDKLKLIQMVHDNPILWDSRLPNFKGAEEEKNRAWEQIGKEFNAPGRRVARAFKSLRESYRRELAHVKLMGNGFKPKWSLYDAMDFLRDVIRERKGGSHAAEHSIAAASLGLSLNSTFGLHHNGEHQHLHHNNNNNNNNNRNNYVNNNNNKNSNNNNNNNNNNNSNNNNNNNNISKQKAAILLAAHSTNFIEPVAALNLSKCTSTPLNISNDDYYNFIKPELDLSNHSNGSSMGLPTSQLMVNARQQQQEQQQTQSQQQQQQLENNSTPPIATLTSNDSRVTSTHNDSNNTSAAAAAATTTTTATTTNNCRDSTQNNLYDGEGDGLDTADNVSMRSGDDARRIGAAMHEEVEELEAIDADFPYPYILDSNSSTQCVSGMKRPRKQLISENEHEDDDYETQMTKQHHRLRCQQLQGFCGNTFNGGMMLDIPPPQTVREVLNSKFCGFISAKLNSMEDSEADNLMNKILMLLVQTQTNDFK